MIEFSKLWFFRLFGGEIKMSFWAIAKNLPIKGEALRISHLTCP
jgi:hypothetical protein